jgi:hypothetical protein
VEAGKKFRSTLFLCEALNVRQDSITGFVDEEKKRTMTTEAVVKIDAKQVKELREKSGAPMGDCLKALQEAKGEIEAAFVVLRKRGMATAAKKASRTTNEGVVGTYIHAGGKIGVLVELNCESDFVARTDDFQELLRDVAMHIAASEPRFVGRDEVTRRISTGHRLRRRANRLRSLRRCSSVSWASSTRSSACWTSRSSRTRLRPSRRS